MQLVFLHGDGQLSFNTDINKNFSACPWLLSLARRHYRAIFELSKLALKKAFSNGIAR